MMGKHFYITCKKKRRKEVFWQRIYV
jgi:hypothetical protein